jgi:hypothetical protein
MNGWSKSAFRRVRSLGPVGKKKPRQANHAKGWRSFQFTWELDGMTQRWEKTEWESASREIFTPPSDQLIHIKPGSLPYS